MPKKQKWIYFERVFESSIGQVVVPMLVNPYNISEPRIYDIRSQYNQESQIVRDLNQSVYRMHKDNKVSYSKNQSAEQCLRRRSLDTIFSHLRKEEETASLYADNVKTTVSFNDFENIEGFDFNYPGTEVCHIKDTKDGQCDEENKNYWEPRGRFIDLDIDIPIKRFSFDDFQGNRQFNITRGTFKVTPMLFYVFSNNDRSSGKDESEDEYKTLHKPIKAQEANRLIQVELF